MYGNVRRDLYGLAHHRSPTVDRGNLATAIDVAHRFLLDFPMVVVGIAFFGTQAENIPARVDGKRARVDADGNNGVGPILFFEFLDLKGCIRAVDASLAREILDEDGTRAGYRRDVDEALALVDGATGRERQR